MIIMIINITSSWASYHNISFITITTVIIIDTVIISHSISQHFTISAKWPSSCRCRCPCRHRHPWRKHLHHQSKSSMTKIYQFLTQQPIPHQVFLPQVFDKRKVHSNPRRFQTKSSPLAISGEIPVQNTFHSVGQSLIDARFTPPPSLLLLRER